MENKENKELNAKSSCNANKSIDVMLFLIGIDWVTS